MDAPESGECPSQHGWRHLQPWCYRHPGSPIDMSARIGLRHVIPGIAAFKPSEIDVNQQIKDALDVVSPVGQLVQQGLKASDKVAQGRFGEAATAVAPKAVRNPVTGAQEAEHGYATHTKGRKTV